MTTTRAFICIEFPDRIVKEVARIQEIIEKNSPFYYGKLTELENLHLTLKFLGHIDEEKLEKVKSILKKIEFTTLKLNLAYTGTFSLNKTPKIVWIKVAGNIIELQKQIDEQLQDLFKKEKRFMSHLTIARIKKTKSSKNFNDYIKQIKIKTLKFSINSFKLKSSELKPEGPVYTTIEEYKST